MAFGYPEGDADFVDKVKSDLGLFVESSPYDRQVVMGRFKDAPCLGLGSKVVGCSVFWLVWRLGSPCVTRKVDVLSW